MEETKNTENENKAADQGNPFEGFDFSKLLSNEHVAELIKHLLSGGAAMAGNYFLWIKPLQEKMEALNEKISKQDFRIKELENEQDRLVEALNREKENKRENQNSLSSKTEEFFTIKRAKDPDSFRRRYRSARL